jgi:hypothetical protein
VSSRFIVIIRPHTNDENLVRCCIKKAISLFNPELLPGQGTRVFDAIDINARGSEKVSPVVMKGIWIDYDHTKEGIILAEFHDKADNEDKMLMKSISSPSFTAETFGQSHISSTIPLYGLVR